MPMSDADKVALRTFLSTRRGEKVLQPDIQRDMLTYLIAKITEHTILGYRRRR